MAGYKVSYKLLQRQGDEIKAAAKLIEGYAERVAQINGKLGDDAMLAEVRQNLRKLREQLGESRAVLNTAGEFLTKTVENYSGVEVRQVKKVDGTKAHNRDFYKNPVVVASAGGGAAVAAGVTSAAAPSAASTTNVSYTDNSVNITYAAPAPPAASTQDMQPIAAAQPVHPSEGTAFAAPASAAAPDTGVGAAAALAASVIGGAAAGAGGVLGGQELKKRRDARNAADTTKNADDGDYDPEAELEKAIARVRELEKEEQLQ